MKQIYLIYFQSTKNSLLPRKTNSICLKMVFAGLLCASCYEMPHVLQTCAAIYIMYIVSTLCFTVPFTAYL